jgi:hypothetical protein
LNFRFSIFDFRLLAAAVVSRGSKILFVVSLCSAGELAAQGDSSLTESKIEKADAKATAADLLSQNEELRRELSLARESVRTLTDSLAESNLQAEIFRRKYSDLEMRMEALGLESADKDRAKLEQRLLSAVSDLQLLQKERGQYRDKALQLSEAILHLLKTSTGGDARAGEASTCHRFRGTRPSRIADTGCACWRCSPGRGRCWSWGSRPG